MSIISLSTYTDMSGAATPSSGILIGLDTLDGKLKQKDSLGNVTEIGSGGGGSGSSGSSGTSGSSGSSGTSGNIGPQGPDGANSFRWLFGSRGLPGQFEVSDPWSSPSNQVSINYQTSLAVNAQNWLATLGNYITINPNQAYLQITQSDDSSNFALYQVANATDNGTYWSFICTLVSGNGVPVSLSNYTISWVTLGFGGSSGSSGTSGKNGSSGTSGVNGTQGISGIDGSNSLRWVHQAGSGGNITGSFDIDIPPQIITAVTKIYINKTNNDGNNVYDWLLALNDYVTSYPQKVYIQITKTTDASEFGIYSISSSVDNTISGNYFELTVSNVSGKSVSTFNPGDIYSINYTLFGASGSSGSSGSSGTSGKSGSSGTSGSSGSSYGIVTSLLMSGPVPVLPSPSVIPEFYGIDTSGPGPMPVSLNLPVTGTINDGKIIYIKDIHGQADLNNIVINQFATDYIDGSIYPFTMSTPFGKVALLKQAGNWWII